VVGPFPSGEQCGQQSGVTSTCSPPLINSPNCGKQGGAARDSEPFRRSLAAGCVRRAAQ
jgi:hypothetical protein